jgi:hypothetical protein
MIGSIRTHKSVAYIKPIDKRWKGYGKVDPITNQFRFIVRMACACHEHNIPYVLTWGRSDCAMTATIQVIGENIPMPKPLPKPPKLKIVADWKPSIWDAVYRLDAYHDPNIKRMRPGFGISHSSGLCLVHPSDSGELGVTEYGDNEDIRQNWFIIHTASGLGFGLSLSFKRAVDALLLAVSFPADWNRDAESIKSDLACRRAGNTVIAAYGSGYDRDSAKLRLEDLERAA